MKFSQGHENTAGFREKGKEGMQRVRTKAVKIEAVKTFQDQVTEGHQGHSNVASDICRAREFTGN